MQISKSLSLKKSWQVFTRIENKIDINVQSISYTKQLYICYMLYVAHICVRSYKYTFCMHQSDVHVITWANKMLQKQKPKCSWQYWITHTLIFPQQPKVNHFPWWPVMGICTRLIWKKPLCPVPEFIYSIWMSISCKCTQNSLQPNIR